MTVTFDDFHELTHGYPPYPWQSQLAQHLVKHAEWPAQISAPTGAGKTTVLTISIWYLYHQVAEGITRTAPLRSVLAVERKLIVDDAARHAHRIANAVETKPELAEVRATLRQLLPNYLREDTSVPTIHVTSMHGDSSWDNMWWRPVGASIITGTMTQIVSRVLFRGVGVSRGRQSIDAGILGSDCVRFCDEPHLMQQAVKTLQQQGAMVKHRTPQTVVLGATVPEQMRSDDAFVAQVPDSARRWRPLSVIDTEKKKDTIATLAEQALAAHNEGGQVVVLVSTTTFANEVAAYIRKKKVPAQVYTSHVRPADRQAIRVLDKSDIEQLDTNTHAFDDQNTIPSVQRIIVATQTLEVGVDYDAKTIVSDLASLPSLIQRAGRAGRFGRHARVVVVTTQNPATQLKGHSAVYEAEVLEATREALLDPYLASLDDLDITDPRFANTWVAPARQIDLDADMADLLWDVEADAPWEAFLRGPDFEDAISVNIAWRDEPDLAAVVPLVSSETISLPLHTVRVALSSEKPKTEDTDLDTAESTTTKADSQLSSRVEGAHILRYDPELQELIAEKLSSTREIYPGTTIVLPTTAGMYTPEQGWNPTETTFVPDMALATASKRFKESIPARLYLGEEFDAIRTGEINYDLPVGKAWAHAGRVIVERARKVDADTTPEPVFLADHLHQVAEYAETTAREAGTFIPPAEYHRAGLHHDLGKLTPGFQRGVLGNADDSQPWAKSSLQSVRLPKTLPRPWRHESTPARLLFDAGFTAAAYLVADHHGKGTIHDMGGQLYQVCQTIPGLSPWDHALASAVFRFADWTASANPHHYGLKMNDLKPELVPFEDLQTLERNTPTSPVVRLEGLKAQPMAGTLAAFGAFASVAQKDSSARIRFVDGVAEIASHSEICWEPVGNFTVGKNHDLAGEYPLSVSSEYWPVDKKIKMATCVLPNNGLPAAAATHNNVSTNVLFDAAIGWDIEAKDGGFDIAGHYGPRRTFAPMARPDVIAWAVKGQMSWGSPSSELGAGTSAAGVLCLPVFSEWMSFDEVRAAARRGYGYLFTAGSLNKYMKAWEPYTP